MGESVLERRAKERRAKQRKQRAAAGTAAMDQFKGRSAEYQGRTRTDYTPKATSPIIKIEKGTAAKHSPKQIGPKEGFLKVN